MEKHKSYLFRPKKKSNISTSKTDKFENNKNLQKLVFYIIIVNFGQGDNMIKLLKDNHSSAQFIRIGEGTASREIKDILSIENNRKEIIYSLVNENYVEDIKKEIEAYFSVNKKNAGLAFTINVDSMIGVKLYKFLSQTVRG